MYIYVCIYIKILFVALFLFAFLTHFSKFSIAKQQVLTRTLRRRFTGCCADASPPPTKALLTGMPPLGITAGVLRQ